MFESANEQISGGDEIKKCPGESNCSMFKLAFGETKNGLDACAVCELLPTKPEPNQPINDGDPLFNEIAELINESDAGFTPDFETYEHWKLFIYWRNVEKQIRHLWDTRHQAWLKSHWEK